jgi:hypothetical protein
VWFTGPGPHSSEWVGQSLVQRVFVFFPCLLNRQDPTFFVVVILRFELRASHSGAVQLEPLQQSFFCVRYF